MLFRAGIDDRFVVDAVFPRRISLASSHDFVPRMRRTEVRPICRRVAVSDLLMPARCSFRISAACRATVSGRLSLLPLCRACAKPAGQSLELAGQPSLDRLAVGRSFRPEEIEMKKVLVLGAGGQIARWVIQMLADSKDINLTLYLRHARKLQRKAPHSTW
jgi:hypothetical protein